MFCMQRVTEVALKRLLAYASTCAKGCAAAAITFSMAGCGDVTESEYANNSGSIIDGSGAPVPNVASAVTGPIEGFGSVFIDGVRYTTKNAEVFIDGELSDEKDLNLGDFITLLASAEDESGEIAAQVIYAESAVRGPISEIDAKSGALKVLGQTIVVSRETFFGEGVVGQDAFNVGDVVDVRGPSSTNGGVIATRIYPAQERKSSLPGIIQSLNAVNSQFLLSGITVDYSSASEWPGELSNGLSVIVKGEFDSISQRFNAESIRVRRDALNFTSGVVIHSEGVANNITRADNSDMAGSFELARQMILVTPQTQWINSSQGEANFSALSEGQYIVVFGRTNAAEQVVAERIIIRRSLVEFLPAEVSGMVLDITITKEASVQTAAFGYIVIDKDIVKVDHKTQFVAIGIGGFGGRIGFDDLMVGDTVNVRGVRESLGDGFDVDSIMKEFETFDAELLNGPIHARIIEVNRGPEFF